MPSETKKSRANLGLTEESIRGENAWNECNGGGRVFHSSYEQMYKKHVARVKNSEETGAEVEELRDREEERRKKELENLKKKLEDEQKAKHKARRRIHAIFWSCVGVAAAAFTFLASSWYIDRVSEKIIGEYKQEISPVERETLDTAFRSESSCWLEEENLKCLVEDPCISIKSGLKDYRDPFTRDTISVTQSVCVSGNKTVEASIDDIELAYVTVPYFPFSLINPIMLNLKFKDEIRSFYSSKGGIELNTPDGARTLVHLLATYKKDLDDKKRAEAERKRDETEKERKIVEEERKKREKEPIDIHLGKINNQDYTCINWWHKIEEDFILALKKFCVDGGAETIQGDGRMFVGPLLCSIHEITIYNTVYKVVEQFGGIKFDDIKSARGLSYRNGISVLEITAKREVFRISEEFSYSFFEEWYRHHTSSGHPMSYVKGSARDKLLSVEKLERKRVLKEIFENYGISSGIKEVDNSLGLSNADNVREYTLKIMFPKMPTVSGASINVPSYYMLQGVDNKGNWFGFDLPDLKEGELAKLLHNVRWNMQRDWNKEGEYEVECFSWKRQKETRQIRGNSNLSAKSQNEQVKVLADLVATHNYWIKQRDMNTKELLEKFKDTGDYEERECYLHSLEWQIHNKKGAKKTFVKIVDEWVKELCKFTEGAFNSPESNSYKKMFELYATTKAELEGKSEYLIYENARGCILKCEVRKGNAICITTFESPPY